MKNLYVELISTGAYVSINDVNKNEWAGIQKKKLNSPYRCIKCKEPMQLRMGKINIHHFSHFSKTNCPGESDLHVCAKKTIWKYLDRFTFYNCQYYCFVIITTLLSYHISIKICN